MTFFGKKWLYEEISVAEIADFGCGVAEKISARTKNTQKCFQKNFGGGNPILRHHRPRKVKKR